MIHIHITTGLIDGPAGGRLNQSEQNTRSWSLCNPWLQSPRTPLGRAEDGKQNGRDAQRLTTHCLSACLSVIAANYHRGSFTMKQTLSLSRAPTPSERNEFMLLLP